MIEETNLPLILLAALIATSSPGPATLAIAGTSMNSGRRRGLAIASGVTTGSWIWSIAAALGLGGLMLANARAFEIVRYYGALYLLYLAYRSARAALDNQTRSTPAINISTNRAAYSKGLALHLGNPKAILFFGSLFAIGVPIDAPLSSLVLIIFAVGLQSMIVFHGYAVLFSCTPVIAAYARLARWFEAAFALAFGAAGFKILGTRLE